MTGAADRSGRRGSRVWLLGAGCGMLATMATPTALLAGVLLAPALCAWIADPTANRTLARPMLFCGLAAALRPLLTLWQSGHTMAGAMAILGDVATVGLAWVAQAVAWLASELLPLLMALIEAARSRTRAARLRAERARLEEEWGLPSSDRG